MTTWVVVADRMRARFFEAGKGLAGLMELEDLVHPEAREPERDLVEDRKGRESGQWGRQTFEPRTHPREKETREFVHELGVRLSHAVDDGSFDRLVICAEPGLLGQLRSGLPHKVTRKITAEVDRDLASKVRPEDIRPYLEDAL